MDLDWSILDKAKPYQLLQLFNEKYTFTIRKNIQNYIEKVELSIKRMRWKAHLYENSGLNASNPLNYVLKAGYVHHSIKILCNFKTTC